MQYAPSSPGILFFILRLNILSRYRAVETSRPVGGGGGGRELAAAGGRGRHPEAGDGVALCHRAIKILPAFVFDRELICEPEGDSPSCDNSFLLAVNAFASP